MRIYERPKRGWSGEKGKIQRGNKGKEEDQSRHLSSGHPHAPPPLLPLSSSSSFVCLITGCILLPCLVYLRFFSFFPLLSVKKHLSSIIFKPTLSMSAPFLAAFPSMSLNHRHCQKSVYLLSPIHTLYSICLTPCLTPPSFSVPSFHFSLVPVDHISAESTFKCLLLHTKEQSHNSTKSPVLKHTCPRILQRGKNKSRGWLTYTNTFPRIKPFSAIKGFSSKALYLHI